MAYLIILIAVFCGYKIFANKGQKRLNWFVCSLLLISSAIQVVHKPAMQSHRFFIVCFWLSILIHKEYGRRKFPLVTPLAIYVVLMLVVGFKSELLTPFYMVYKPFVMMLDTYLVLLMAYWGFTRETFYTKSIIISLYCVCLYGLFTYVIHYNPIQDFVISTFNIRTTVGQDYFFGDRIRICSTWSHPIAYGLVASAFFYEFLPWIKQRKIMLLEILLCINVFICGSRTALVSFLLMGMIVMLFRYRLGKTVKNVFVVLALAVLTYSLVPMVHEKIDSVINTAQGKEDVGGSSLEMRNTQTEYALLYFIESPIFGHGFDWIGEGLGYGTDNYQGDTHMLGFESYSYVILIERGIIGAIAEIMILLSLIYYFWSKRKQNPTCSSYGLAALLGFVFFSLSTGTLDTKIPLFFMIGMSMARIAPPEIVKEIYNFFSCVWHKDLKLSAI